MYNSIVSNFSSSPLSQAIPPRAYRGQIAHALDRNEIQFFPDGALLVDAEGRIVTCDDWQTLVAQGAIDGFKQVDMPPEAFILPGFIDLHVHLPQFSVTGCQSDSLLSWLETHIFQEEARFADAHYARDISRVFFKALLAAGTTTAAVFLTSHPEATQIAFETALETGNRVVMGQNLMDCNGPDALLRPARQLLQETEGLACQWHNMDNERLQYAWMPRFAITSTPDLLKGIGDLRQTYPSVYLHTHLSEQPGEIAAVLRQFPESSDYTGVYELAGLLGPRTILAHGIHLSDDELTRIGHHQSSLAHCPTSNFFLKSGPFRWFEVWKRQMLLGFGSDVGAGPELNLFETMKAAQYMQSTVLIPLEALFYTATLGGARALDQSGRIGNFLPGKEADFIIGSLADHHAVPHLKNVEIQDVAPVDSLSAFRALFSRLVYLGDERALCRTMVRGRCVFEKASKS